MLLMLATTKENVVKASVAVTLKIAKANAVKANVAGTLKAQKVSVAKVNVAANLVSSLSANKIVIRLLS